MKKEDILTSAQKDKNKNKEFENCESTRGYLLAMVASLIVGLIMLAIKCFAKGEIVWELIEILLVACGTSCLYNGIKVKKAGLIIFGSVQAAFAAIGFIVFVVMVIAA